ncbi:MAG: spore coat protein CotJB [Bacilli bacterium]|nr:spore coat protein CotJB [Bacilli bacterium]
MNSYMENNWIRESNNSYPNRLLNSKEGFIKGNMFQDLYNPYKNYQPQDLIPKTEQEKCLYELSAVTFAAHELNLYLDLHPEDQSMFMLFTDYQKKAHRLMEEYEDKYGPIMVNSKEMNNSFSWAQTNWPWEGKNV